MARKAFKVVKRKSENVSSNVFVLQNTRFPSVFKDIAFGQRAEFRTKLQAQAFAKRVNKTLRR